MQYVYKDPRPRLTIEFVRGWGLGNCYSAAEWRVTTRYRLEEDQLKGLNQLGVLGFGQEFYVRSNPEEPAGFDEVPCVGQDEAGNEYSNPLNPYSGEPYGPTTMGYYIAICESRVDSSD